LPYYIFATILLADILQQTRFYANGIYKTTIPIGNGYGERELTAE
jgi:hypothetical protein